MGIFDILIFLIFESGFHFIVFLKEFSVGNEAIFGNFGFDLGFHLSAVAKVGYGIEQAIMADHADKTGNAMLLGRG